jgi:hypothetical protein
VATTGREQARQQACLHPAYPTAALRARIRERAATTRPPQRAFITSLHRCGTYSAAALPSKQSGFYGPFRAFFARATQISVCYKDGSHQEEHSMAKGQEAPKTHNKPKLTVKEKKAKKKEKAASK